VSVPSSPFGDVEDEFREYLRSGPAKLLARIGECAEGKKPPAARPSARVLGLVPALDEYLPKGSRARVYGSLLESDRFREWSDVDLALERDPPEMSIYLLASLLSERCGRPVDVCLIGETRLEPVIRR
jgi:predicted nucleotidyltransferase